MDNTIIPIAVLFARTDSIYKTIPGCDVYDIERDAKTFGGNMPVIAHPPCRAWGRLAHMAKPRIGEVELAPWAVDQVRTCGGVLEHPEKSRLWRYCNLPLPGQPKDKYGGWTLSIVQCQWGHRATKPTWLYIVGTDDIPPIPNGPKVGTHVIACDRRPGVNSKNAGKPHLPIKEREATPIMFALWLVNLVQMTKLRV